MATYGPIGGPLPFSGGGESYAGAYNAALQFNSANYAQILSGYNNTAQSQQQEQQRILGGYGQLQGNVMGSIAGIDKAQRQQIADTYSQNVGAESQRLISRGLGNSTVQQSVARGLLYDKEKSDVNLTNQTQGLNAQYMSQLGLAGLGYQERANQQNTSLASQQLQWLNSINAAYPDARAYAQLAQMKGQAAGGAGFQVPGGIPGSSGSVKSPLGPGGGSNPPGYYGSGYGGNYGAARPQGTAPYGGAPQNLDMSQYEMAPMPGYQNWSQAELGTLPGPGPGVGWDDYSGSPMDGGGGGGGMTFQGSPVSSLAGYGGIPEEQQWADAGEIYDTMGGY